MKYYNSKNVLIKLAKKPIASGGEGKVFRIISSNYLGYCAKIFYEQRRKEKNRFSKLKFMIHNPPKVIKEKGFVICWPEDLLFVKGEFVGFIMPLAFEKSIPSYALCNPNIPKKLNFVWEKKYDRNSKKGILARLKLCVNISIAINHIHNIGSYVFVDLKPQNILITDEGKVSLIDFDSIQITKQDNVLYHATVATPEYMPPESRRLDFSIDKINESWDRFSLSIIFYQLLVGTHPFSGGTIKANYGEIATVRERILKGYYPLGIHKNKFKMIPNIHNTSLKKYPRQLLHLFKNDFEVGFHSPSKRLRPKEWGHNLFQLITAQKNLTLPTKTTKKANTSTSKKNNKISRAILLLATGLILFIAYNWFAISLQTVVKSTNTSQSSKGVLKKQRLSEPEITVRAFLNHIANQEYTKAYKLQRNKHWKDYAVFTSKKRGYGGVEEVKFYSSDFQLIGLSKAEVNLSYYAKDPVNDQMRRKKSQMHCNIPGINYKQKFILEKLNENWFIVSTKLLSAKCKGQNIFR